MRASIATLGAIMVATMFVGIATAHPKEYLNNNQQTGLLVALVDCDDTDGVDDLNFGGFCYGPEHIEADDLGEAVLSAEDDVFNPVPFMYCQDLNGDTFCGGLPTDDPDAGPRRLEPRVNACGEVTLRTPLEAGLKTPEEWRDSGNWDTALEVIAFTRGLLLANPVTNAACPGQLNPAIHGFSNH